MAAAEQAFAHPQLHQAPIRLRPIVESLRGGPAAVASGPAKLRGLASAARERITHSSEVADADASDGGEGIAQRIRARARHELAAGGYELRETWSDVARLARRLRRRRHGVRVGQEALARYRQTGDHRREALELNSLARIYRSRGQYQEAVVCYTQALTLFQRLGNQRGECLSLSNLGLAHDGQGHRQKALRCYEEALDIARMLRDRQIEGQILANLGTAYNRQGRRREARERWHEALTLLTPGSSAHRQLSQHLG